MIRHVQKSVYLIASLLLLASTSKAQNNAVQTKVTLYEGIAVAGYVDGGGYVNCTGPGLKFTKKPLVLILGLLPSLRIKKDKVAAGAPKNSFVMPNLGAGLTVAFKQLAIQLPLYYNAKTNTIDGKWNPGIGVGYKF